MADKQALIDGLNEDLNLELEAVLRMIYHSATATGLLGHELRESLKEDITGEIGHATYLADKIVALGGEPHIHPQMPKKHKSAKEMLQDDVAAERTIIENYTRHIAMAEELGEKGLVIRLEDILAEETDHAEELERLAREREVRMSDHVVLLSVPGLRDKDLAALPNLRGLVAAGDRAALVPSFPCVTCPVQVNMTTGKPPAEHGVVANGFYWRDKRQVEMWTASNDVIEGPQIWDVLRQHDAELRCAVWFPLLAKGAGADWICTPAPIHNPDGSESLWCYTRPTELYGELRDALGHFPLQHFWGPLANIKSTAWIVDSAIHLARRERPNFFYIYLPHLDYAAQMTGPDSPEARQSLADLDNALGRLIAGFSDAYGGLSSRKDEPLWLIASEYTIGAVDYVVYPNRVLREAGLLVVREEDGCEQLDFANSRAWAMVDHQFAHVYVNGGADEIARVRELFVGREGIDEVLSGDDLARYELNHERAGEVVLVSAPNSWQAYYWWLDDARAPRFARSVDIHRKPGYDPVELHLDFATKSIPLDATRVKGSHGAPAREKSQHGVMLTSQPGVLEGPPMADTDVFDLVLRQFGI